MSISDSADAAASKRCHVILAIADGNEKTWRDFGRMAAIARSHGVEAHVVKHRRANEIRLLWLWTQPTLSLCPVGPGRRRLLPGRFMSGRLIGKVKEYATLEAAGVALPKWIEITPSIVIDPAQWGPYVVEKPSHGQKGACVRIRKASRIRYVPPEAFPLDHPGRLGPMIAQQFIYTGEWPTSYRVVTFFGEVLLCYRQVTRDRGAPLRSRWDFGEGGRSIVSNTKTMEISLRKEQGAMALASQAHMAAFPDIPLLQFDIVRDFDTGEYFVLECHPWEHTWPFSSLAHPSFQKSGNDFDGQFRAIDKAGRIIAAKARELATRLPTRMEAAGHGAPN